MQINIFSIQKNVLDFKILSDKYIKLISNFANIKDFFIFNNKINQAQKLGVSFAQKSYEEHLIPYKKNFCIILHERGKKYNSLEFANIIKNKNEISFFIGGAFGFSEEFIKSFDMVISLSRMTLAHNLAKIILLEQLYRAFCINSNHPYHK